MLVRDTGIESDGRPSDGPGKLGIVATTKNAGELNAFDLGKSVSYTSTDASVRGILKVINHFTTETVLMIGEANVTIPMPHRQIRTIEFHD